MARINIDNARLVNYNVFVKDRSLYMMLSFEFETDEGVYIIKIPKVALPFDLRGNSLTIETVSKIVPITNLISNGSCTKFLLCGDSERETFPYEIKRIKDKPKKMTIEEIERELGYKIQLVNEK